MIFLKISLNFSSDLREEKKESEVKFWINVVHKDHVLVGREHGFLQAGHGKKSFLDRMSAGDFVIFYSPKTSVENGDTLQTFTAIARLTDENIYQAKMADRIKPFRRNAQYFKCVEIPIRPLLGDLDFIADESNWGYPFRQGLFEISEPDFKIIAGNMQADFRRTI